MAETDKAARKGEIANDSVLGQMADDANHVWPSVFLSACYVVMVVIAYSVLTSIGGWPTGDTLRDWKTYLALSVAMFFPGITVITWAWAIPLVEFWGALKDRLGRLIPDWLKELNRDATPADAQASGSD